MGFNALIGNRGKEIIDQLEEARAYHKSRFGVDLPIVVMTEEEIRHFLVYVRFYHSEEAKNGRVPDGFPVAGERGYAYRGIKIKIIKPNIYTLS